MRTIFKYPLNLMADTTIIDVPYQNQRVKVGEDDRGNLCVWYLINTDDCPPDMVQRFEYRVYGTGWQINEPIRPFDDGYQSYDHVDSVKMSDLIWHVFCRMKFE